MYIITFCFHVDFKYKQILFISLWVLIIAFCVSFCGFWWLFKEIFHLKMKILYFTHIHEEQKEEFWVILLCTFKYAEWRMKFECYFKE